MASGTGYGGRVADDMTTSDSGSLRWSALHRRSGSGRSLVPPLSEESAARRDYLFTRVFNFRDVGGRTGLDGRTVRWRRLFRSDSLGGLCDPDRDDFLALGVRTVLDLRQPEELERDGRVPDWDGIAYHNIAPGYPPWQATPIRDGDDPARYLADRYLEMAEHGAPAFAGALGLIADDRTTPLVVHCAAGKDRTGVACALTLTALGVSDADIAADYALSTAGSARYLAWARANGQPELVASPWWAAPPEAMLLFLTDLRQRYGSVEGYLAAAGLDAGHLAALRGHLLA
jgi:protein tyrosine/serine phosphatase